MSSQNYAWLDLDRFVVDSGHKMKIQHSDQRTRNIFISDRANNANQTIKSKLMFTYLWHVQNHINLRKVI